MKGVPMETVFSHIISKRYSHSYEDVATDALAYILEHHDLAHKNMMEFLQKIIPKIPNLFYRSQVTEGSIRPDICGIADGKTSIFIENKFWAGLTENQPIAYLNELANYEQPTMLLFIVSGAREQTMIVELTRRLNEGELEFSEIASDNKAIVWYVKTGIGPYLILSSWPRLIKVLRKNEDESTKLSHDLMLLESLCDAADIDKFIPFSAAYLNDQTTPAVLLQLGQVIRDSVEMGLREGLLDKSGLNETSSWDKFGRYFSFREKHFVGVWYGIDYKLWKTYGVSPLWLVFSTTDFGRAYEVRGLLENQNNEANFFVKLPDGSLALAINLLTGADKDQVTKDIVNQFRNILILLSDLPLQ